MCNAWNHSPYCTCGWGGLGHLGVRASGTYTHHAYGSEYWWVPPITHTYESYINPNALCPVCGASVFFYQTPNGGRVFFDELGPPWPKHPCTDNSSVPKNTGTTSTPSFGSGNTHIYNWQKEGWNPFFINFVSGIDNFILKISETFNDKELILYVEKIVNHYRIQSEPNPIAKENIAHIRKLTGQRYELSLVTAFGNSITINAFSTLSEARQNRSTSFTSLKTSLTKRLKVRLPKSQSNKQNTQVSTAKTSNVSGNKSPPNPAMALAFAEALKKQDRK